MDCPICGRPYPCAHCWTNASALRDHAVHAEQSVARAGQNHAINPPSAGEAQRQADEELWRREVASRVQQHRARRRRRFDPNASLEFDFPAETALAIAPIRPAPQPPLISFAEQDGAASYVSSCATEAAAPSLAPPKIIRFPRCPPPDAAQFADALEPVEPVQPAPRILDTPEPRQLELLPTFPDIRLDEDEEPSEARFLGIDLPPQPAAPLLRIFSAVIDCMLLLLAEVLFIAVFVQLGETLPSLRVAAPYALLSCVAFLCLFQYLFLVFGRGTPGMRAAGVELCTFNGQAAKVPARRSRAFAVTLSALSVGLGFFWALVDEDTLGWHDRISETYLRDSTQRPIISPQRGR